MGAVLSGSDGRSTPAVIGDRRPPAPLLSALGLGPIVQNAFVVPDLDSALGYWLNLGVGPFYHVPHARSREMFYRGARMPADYAVAIACWGEMQIELIAPLDSSPSVYRDFLDEGRDGLHHMLTIVPDLDAVRSSAAAAGYEILGETLLDPFGGVLYLRAPEQRWPLIEVGHFAPNTIEFFAAIRQASLGWDGRDPVRLV